MSKSNNLLEIWDTYKNSVLLEKKLDRSNKLGTKPGPGAKPLNDEANKKFQHEDSGPEKAEGVKSLDGKSKKDKKKAPKKTVEEQKTDREIQKTVSEKINNNMKSVFDKLFEEVMNDQELQDAEALGVDVADDDVATEVDDVDGEITIKLKPEHVEVLRAILAQVDGEGDLEVDELDDDVDLGDDFDDDLDDSEDLTVDEGVDCEEIGHAIQDEKKLEKGFTSTKNNEVGNLKAKSGKADSKVTDKVGNDGNLADSKGQSLTKPGNHKVGGKINKSGANAFEL